MACLLLVAGVIARDSSGYFEGVTAREGVPFPQLREGIDEVTKSIYPGIFKKNV